MYCFKGRYGNILSTLFIKRLCLCLLIVEIIFYLLTEFNFTYRIVILHPNSVRIVLAFVLSLLFFMIKHMTISLLEIKVTPELLFSIIQRLLQPSITIFFHN